MLYPVVVYRAWSFGMVVMPCSLGLSVVTEIMKMNSGTGIVGALQFLELEQGYEFILMGL